MIYLEGVPVDSDEYRQRLIDEIALEAMKSFIFHRADMVKEASMIRGMSLAQFISGVSWEMAEEFMRERDRRFPRDEDL